jgi:DNA mismatch repair protein MutH
VELKTVPVDERGRVRESTFVTGVRLRDLRGEWLESRVREKLACVLFMPIVGEGPPAERYLGGPLLWRPDADQERVLAADWAELALLALEGSLDQLVGQRGEALQLRPKAARAERTEWVLDADQRWVTEQPRGFYLRARFVERVLAGGLRR